MNERDYSCRTVVSHVHKLSYRLMCPVDRLGHVMVKHDRIVHINHGLVGHQACKADDCVLSRLLFAASRILDVVLRVETQLGVKGLDV